MSYYTPNPSQIHFCPSKVIEECNERIAYHERFLHDDDVVSEDFTKVLNIGIKIAKVEILIVTNIKNELANKRIYPLLLEKYDELLNEDYEVRQKMVLDGMMEEEDYRKYCKNSVDLRNTLKKVCKGGEGNSIVRKYTI
jgi:ribosomal protein S17E